MRVIERESADLAGMIGYLGKGSDQGQIRRGPILGNT
jgi:hypothetical protein